MSELIQELIKNKFDFSDKKVRHDIYVQAKQIYLEKIADGIFVGMEFCINKVLYRQFFALKTDYVPPIVSGDREIIKNFPEVHDLHLIYGKKYYNHYMWTMTDTGSRLNAFDLIIKQTE